MSNGARRSWRLSLLLGCGGLLALAGLQASVQADQPVNGTVQGLARHLGPFLDCIQGKTDPFVVHGQVEVEIGGQPQTVELKLVRYDQHAFDFQLSHPDYAMQLRRRSERTAFALPKHSTVYLGSGPVDEQDHLQPRDIVGRLIGSGSQVATFAPLVMHSDANTTATLLTSLLGGTFDHDSQTWRFGDVRVDNRQSHHLSLQMKENRVTLSIDRDVPAMTPVEDWPGMQIVQLPRAELERTFARGARRALEILAPAPLLTAPPQAERDVPGGQLRWVDGQRVVLLKGTPQQIGAAHAQLLATESRRCIDSVLHTFAIVQTIRTGRWFRHDLDAAYERLAPHIPQDHKDETLAFARTLGIDPRIAHAINIFPELFHCSGFAVFGEATADGKLYHGRVLDYMTTIGLQDAATTFIVAVEGKYGFANVGYAGFIGSVSGMNEQAISLGEMGGAGEGDWDGVPMATLMRRALEECQSLKEVKTLWESSPRTCEYFYVFADGKTNQCVGVLAIPERVEFVGPGESHERLGAGIPDTVVLSAGSRLEKLRERVQQRYGKIDVETAQWLMSRPVAMESNLHNVLFVPQDGILYVANASHKEPAANRPYSRIDLRVLLQSLRAMPTAPIAAR